MIQVHGWDATIQRMQTAYESWTHKRRKDGGSYSKTNPAWIEYAVANESLGTPQTTREDRTMIELEALQKGLRG